VNPCGVSLGFYVTYLLRELGRRTRQAILIACGLALGVGLVITVTAASTGVRDAQATVLHSLYGIGTDITVTTPARSSPGKPASDTAGPAANQPGALLVGDLGLLRSTSVAAIANRRGVAHAAGGLLLTELGQAGSAFPTTITVDGIELADLRLGPFVSATVVSGRHFSSLDAAANDAIVDSRYAAANNVAVETTITIAHAAFRVIGIINQPQGANAANIYIPVGRAQALTQVDNLQSLDGLVNVIYIEARSASDVRAVQAEITKLLPSATVVSSSNLASTVTGSLASAANLADDLGHWVAAGALIAACAIASLLTSASVSHRVREFGTLKALGWQTRRIVVQILGESLVTGTIGALIGIACGFGGVAFVNAVAPKLTAAIPQQGDGTSATTVAVHLAAHVNVSTVLVAILLAVGGALIAGSFGAWRAAKLRPADAFVRVA
jgi:putative ABC transport system permease protein